MYKGSLNGRMLLTGLLFWGLSSLASASDPEMIFDGQVYVNPTDSDDAGVTVLTTNQPRWGFLQLSSTDKIGGIKSDVGGNGTFYLYDASGNIDFRQVAGGKSYFNPFGPGPTEDFGILGVGTNAPEQALDVNGAIYIREVSEMPTAGSAAQLYCLQEGENPYELWCMDSIATETGTQLTSHRSPNSYYPSAQSSFNDLSINLPFSFHHRNSFIGKGEVVDMAKMVDFVEQLMQSQLGEQQGRLRYGYDLGEDAIETIEGANEKYLNRKAESALTILEDMKWIVVEPAADGSIPTEAIVEVNEMEFVPQKVDVEENQLDLENGKIVPITVRKEIMVQRPTGRRIKQLAANYEFRNGQLYRQPTIDDLDLEALATPMPQLSQWVLDRIPPERRTAMTDPANLSDQIRQRIIAMQAGNELKRHRQSSPGAGSQPDRRGNRLGRRGIIPPPVAQTGRGGPPAPPLPSRLTNLQRQPMLT